MLERVVATGRRRARSLCAAIGAAIERRLAHRVILGVVLALVAMASLGAIGLALHLSDIVNVTRFLAGDDAVGVVDAWQRRGVAPLALAYLAIDAALFVPLYTGLTIAVAHRVSLLDGEDAWRRAVACFATLASVAAFVFDELENALGLAALFGAVAPAFAFVVATRAKLAFAGLAVALVALLGVAWFFALGAASGSMRVVIERARLRAGVVDVVWRNRYTLAGLAFFSGLLLLMDQSRDVLVGLAQALQSAQFAGALFVMTASALALWSVAYTVWMWSRILCRERRAAWAAQVATLPIPAPAPRTGKDEAVVPLPGPIADKPPSQTWPRGVFHFAQWFARFAGVVPVLVLVGLCGSAAGDAARAGARDSAYLLLLFGALSLAGAILFLWRRTDAGEDVPLEHYYEGVAAHADLRDELTSPHYRFLMLPHAPLTLPVAALAFASLLRLLNAAFPALPSVAFVVICLSTTLWLGVIGLVSQLALRHGRPYPLALIVLVAVLGWGGCTDNHVVSAPPPDAATPPAWTPYAMWAFHASIAAIIVAGAWIVYRTRFSRARTALVAFATVGALIGTLAVADRVLPRSLAQAQTLAPIARPPVSAALERWLASLCTPGTPCDDDTDTPLPVYVVASEGGGIRAAYWTALVLAQLSERIPDFTARTFAVSGVSGGAMGAAVFRSCATAVSETLAACVQRFGRADLLTPLVSAWMFDDVLARFVPTSHCATPGCGVMTRGAWFEQAMARAAPGLDARLVPAQGAGATPYLLLNATWVETGERAIASDIAIDSRDFPTARDQAAVLGHDLTLAGAAHNASRFPFINAIGTVRSAGDACPEPRDDETSSRARRVCGHVADGGYFDNSGGHTGGDVLRALSRLLHQPQVATLSSRQLAWLRRNLVLQAVMIRNGLEAQKSRIESVAPASASSRCDAADPSLPRCRGRFWLLTDLLGPAVAAFNAVGTGANGRMAESLLDRTVEASRFDLAMRTTQPRVVTFDLATQDVLYPLGWYLSARARSCMERAADANPSYRALCRPDDAACIERATRAPRDDPSSQAC